MGISRSDFCCDCPAHVHGEGITYTNLQLISEIEVYVVSVKYLKKVRESKLFSI